MDRKFSGSEMESMESWRGILAIFVCIAHIFQINIFPYIGVTGIIQGTLRLIANISVVIFFVLSGILISYSAENLVVNGVFDWKKFLINRFTRIYPTLLVVSLLSLMYIGLNYFINGNTSIVKLGFESYVARTIYFVRPLDCLLSLFMIFPGMTEINGSLWSLYIEWWLYISFMVFFLAMNSKRGKPLLYLGSVVPFIVPLYFFGPEIIAYASIWALGALFTMYLRHQKRQMFILRILAIVSLGTYMVLVGPRGLDILETNWKVFAFLQIIVAFFSIDAVRRLPLGNLIARSGRFSYTLYVLHFPTVLLLFSLLHRFYYDNIPLIISSSIGYLFFLILSSFYISKVTENKAYFRKLFTRNPAESPDRLQWE